jgi:hypothetical protein
MTLPELLDYKESLDVVYMMTEASHKDAEREAKIKSK